MNSSGPRFGRAALWWAPFCVLWGGCGRAPAPAAAPATAPVSMATVRYQTDWYPQPEQGGCFQAAAKGFYREAGIEVQILAGGPGRAMVTGLLAGQDDIETAESVDVISRVSSGLPLVMVAAVMEHDPVAVMVHEESPVHTFADLNGRTVMALPGTTWMAYVKWRYHIDFHLIPINYGIAQFMADPNFVQQCFITSEPYFVAQHGGKSRAMLVAESGYDPYRVYVTTRKFAQEHPRELRAFVAASIRGWNDFAQGDPTPGAKMIQSLNPQMTPEFEAYSIKAMKQYHLIAGDPAKGDRTGLITTRRLQEQIDLMVAIKAIPRPITVSELATFEFLPDDLQALAR